MTGIYNCSKYIHNICMYLRTSTLMFFYPSLKESITQEELQPPLSSPTPSADSAMQGTSRSASPLPSTKKRRMDSAGEGDKALLESLKEIQDNARERRTKKEDMDLNFALEVAGRLRRLPPRQTSNSTAIV